MVSEHEPEFSFVGKLSSASARLEVFRSTCRLVCTEISSIWDKDHQWRLITDTAKQLMRSSCESLIISTYEKNASFLHHCQCCPSRNTAFSLIFKSYIFPPKSFKANGCFFLLLLQLQIMRKKPSLLKHSGLFISFLSHLLSLF